MSEYEKGRGGLSCPACGATLEASLEEQYFCEHCGAPLAREPQAPGSAPPESATLPDWLDEPESVATPPAPASRLVLQPRTPPDQRARQAAERGGGPPTGTIAIFVLLGLLCLGFALVALVGLSLVGGG